MPSALKRVLRGDREIYIPAKQLPFLFTCVTMLLNQTHSVSRDRGQNDSPASLKGSPYMSLPEGVARVGV